MQYNILGRQGKRIGWLPQLSREEDTRQPPYLRINRRLSAAKLSPVGRPRARTREGRMPTHATRTVSEPARQKRCLGQEAYTIQPYNRFWAVRDSSGSLVCVTVYKRGAKEVVRRLGRSL